MTDRLDGVSRRRFVSIAAASAAVPALAGCTSSGDDAEPADGDDGGDGGGSGDGSSDGSDGSDDSGGGDGSTVVVGPGGDFSFDPEELTVSTGTTVTFEWDSDFHNVVPTSQPDDADWSGETETFNSGHTYEYTFEVAGTYEYVCEPHEGSGMVGTIVVE